MHRLPSFVKLLLLFVVGLGLQFGGAMGIIYCSGHWTASVFQALALLGLVLILVSPLLALLKLAGRLYNKV